MNTKTSPSIFLVIKPMNDDSLVPISLVEHGHTFERKKINPNEWKQRTNSNDLKEDFQDILELRNSFKHPENINELIKENLQNKSFKDTKKLLNSITNTSPSALQPDYKKNVFLHLNTRNAEPNIENIYEPQELIRNTHKVTEKIKLLNLFDDVEIDHMDIIENDSESDDVEMEDLVNEDILDHENKHSNSNSDIELLDSDCNKNNISMKTVLKSIVNPTELGIQYAQSVLENEEQEQENPNKEQQKQESSFKEENTTNMETETKQTDNGKHITINNHYYNYFNVNQPVNSENLEHKQQKLPNPWSSESTPMQKQVYNITTYFQLALNGSIYFLTILIVTIFIKTITHDLSNLFYQQKQDQLNQISKCTEMYEINKCYLGIPKMSEVCSSWQRCMMDNPDKKVVNKTRIYVNLLTSILSEFLSTIGFLNSISLCMLMYSAYFVLNLFFGYIRGKSYGKEQAKSRIQKSPDAIEMPKEDLTGDYKKQPLVLTY